MMPGVCFANRCQLINRLLGEQNLMQWEYIREQPLPDRHDRNLALVHAGVDLLASRNAAIADLQEILNTESSPHVAGDARTGDVKQRLKEWAKKHRIPFEPVFPDEIAILGAKYFIAGELTREDVTVSKSNALIPREFWNRMVADGKWPIVDPHDLISHLPDLVSPEYAALLGHKARLFNDLEASRSAASPEVRDASEKLVEWMYIVMRPLTWEGNSFLIQSEDGTPQLVLHGNAAYRVVDGIMQNQNNVLVSGLVRVFAPRAKDLERLPRFAEYRASRPQPFMDMVVALDKLGVNEPVYTALRKKMDNIVAKIRVEINGLGPSQTRTSVFLARLAQEMNADPQIRGVFREENRVDFLKKSLAFEEDYFNWIRAQRARP